MMAERDPPRRGGIHPTYGVFIGGAPLDDNAVEPAVILWS